MITVDAAVDRIAGSAIPNTLKRSLGGNNCNCNGGGNADDSGDEVFSLNLEHEFHSRI